MTNISAQDLSYVKMHLFFANNEQLKHSLVRLLLCHTEREYDDCWSVAKTLLATTLCFSLVCKKRLLLAILSMRYAPVIGCGRGANGANIGATGLGCVSKYLVLDWCFYFCYPLLIQIASPRSKHSSLISLLGRS